MIKFAKIWTDSFFKDSLASVDTMPVLQEPTNLSDHVVSDKYDRSASGC
jgi:hypothetical protein